MNSQICLSYGVWLSLHSHTEAPTFQQGAANARSNWAASCSAPTEGQSPRGTVGSVDGQPRTTSWFVPVTAVWRVARRGFPLPHFGRFALLKLLAPGHSRPCPGGCLTPHYH